ncbi:tRNA (5-methylaminomethyl-2-thiouridine)(34)-methyltransferase MnmD [Spirochaeta dissipatitropha]
MRFAEIDMRAGGVYSIEFGDCYFSVPDGIDEAFYVYLQANRVGDRIKSCKGVLHIAEIGFGTGLNCALTLREYLSANDPCCNLIYSSFEKFPVRKPDLVRIVNTFAGSHEEFHEIWSDVIESIPEISADISGPVRFQLQLKQGFVLELYIGDAAAELENLQTPVDIWYLDGFSPSIDTGLWNRELFMEISALSGENARFSSFTAAGWVRRGLAEFGWEVQRCPGFGRKRHMICGQYKPQLC